MIDIKMNDLEEVANQLKELQSFMSEIDGDIGSVNFNTQDQNSVNQAIANMETMIDVKAKNYENNQTVLEIVEELKASYKQQILDKALEALENGESE
jgi:hypothetical protein